MLKELERALNRQGDRLTKDVKRAIKKKDLVVSGALYDSVRYELEEVGEGKYVMSFYMLEHGYYQDEGVKGANPSAVRVNGKAGRQKAPRSKFQFGKMTGKGSLFKALDNWIVRKGIAPRNRRGQFMSRQSLRYAMTKSIYYQGIEPKEFFTPVWDKWNKRVPDVLKDALSKDVEKLWLEFVNV